jgi:hypothetical protein
MAFMYYGKKYDTKAELKAAQKKAVGTKGKKKIGNIFEGRLAKEKRAAKASVAQGKRNQAATSKMYAAESMFKSAKSRDDAKVAPGKKRSFKEAFDAATKEGKSKFMLGGKGYLTTKGKREDRFDPTKTKGAEKKESIFSKFKSSKTGSEFFKKLKKKK